MIDRRFPYLQRLREASALPEPERVRAGKIADTICRRTGTSCAWDARTHSLYFYYGTVDTPAFAFPFLIEKDGVVPVTESDVEDMVRMIRMGQMPRDEKDEIAEQNRAKEEYEKAKEQRRFEDDVRPDAQNYADFLLRKRRGTAKVVSA